MWQIYDSRNDMSNILFVRIEMLGVLFAARIAKDQGEIRVRARLKVMP